MWCATCQALAGPDSDSKPSACPRCGNALVDPPEPNTASQQARQLLESWNADNPLDLTPPDADTPPESQTANQTRKTRKIADTSRPQYRVDSAHSKHRKQADGQATQHDAKTTQPTPPQPKTKRSRTKPTADTNRPPPIDPLAQVAATLANFSDDPQPPAAQPDTQPAAQPDTPTDAPAATEPASSGPVDEPEAAAALPPGVTTNALTHSTSLWGQLLAYVGVLGLTAGGALIVWNGFGHAPLNTPTAWLIATGGQMLLLLGIVTLVSSGLEQNHEDINRQLRVLGEQLLRFEQGHAGATPVAPHGRSGQNASTPHDAQPATTSTTKP